MNKEVQIYNNAQYSSDKKICNLLAREISCHLPDAENKIWHAHPVWFLDGNPVAGYSKLKSCIRLLFWSGQSFNEKELQNEGSFKAAEIRFTSVKQISVIDLSRWLKKAAEIQWDYKNLIKRKGVLVKIRAIEQVRDQKISPYGSLKFISIDEYQASFPADIHKKLQQLRETIKKVAPQSKEVISYNMPAFKLNRILVYYSAYKNHIGFYPTSSPIIFFKKELNKYKTSKGAIQFPVDKSLPLRLITRIIKFRLAEESRKSAFAKNRNSK